MRISWLFASVVFVSLSSCPSRVHAEGEPSVSLESLLEAGHRHQPALAKQPLLAESLELTKSKLNRSYWPQLSLGGQATWQSAVTSINIPVPGVNVSSPSKDQYKATLDLKQNIWDGGITADQKRVAETRSDVEREKVKVEWHQVKGRILELYFAGVVQQDLRAQSEALERNLAAVVEKAQVGLKSGVLTERDVLLAEARGLEARQATAEATAELAGARRSLEELTGSTLPKGAVLATPATACGVPSARATVSTLRRPELSLLDAQAALLDAEDQRDRATDNPRLGAFATAGYGRPGLNFLDNSFQPYFIGGFQLTVPLTYLYAGTHQNEGKQLVVQRALVARERDAVVQQVNLALDAQLAELDRLAAVIGVDEQLLELRQRASKQTELQLELGTASMTDLINDLSLEDQARSRRAVHRAQHDLACRQVALIKGDS